MTIFFISSLTFQILCKIDQKNTRETTIPRTTKQQNMRLKSQGLVRLRNDVISNDCMLLAPVVEAKQLWCL